MLTDKAGVFLGAGLDAQEGTGRQSDDMARLDAQTLRSHWALYTGNSGSLEFLGSLRIEGEA